ncbi:MAG: hypothetical protein WC802_04500 [Patescibacteria group bacterium]|jgi:Arc/MetJ-type ribon-helix-helix transcriptional regulator
MITLSIPVPLQLERFVNRMVKNGSASTKAEVVRQALSRYAEEKLVESVLLAEQELKEGKEVRGDLREILKRMR